MAPASIPTSEPTSARVGDTWRWDRSLDDYSPADGWACTCRLRGPSVLDVTGAANAGNTGWEFTVPAATSKALKVGDYEWSLEVSQGSERYTVDAGSLVALLNFATATAGEAVWFETKVIELLEAFLMGSTEDGILESVIAGRQVRLMTPKEARELLIQFRNDRAKRRNGGRFAPIGMEFYRP